MTITASEKKVAREYNDNLQQTIKGIRGKSLTLSGLNFLFAILFGGLQFWVLSFIAFALALVFLLRYFDANGHLHEVQQRSSDRMTSDFSVFNSKMPDPDASRSDHQSAN